MQLTSGTLLRGGTYKIEKVLGQGSFGITYLAEHTALGKKVCIKEFFMKELNSRGDDGSITGLSDGSLSYNYAQKFCKEAQNLARMEHPNIVRVTDCFDENATFYYVMEYIEGQDLNTYIKQHALSEAEAVAIIKDVANALVYMHDEKHMLHLDLKPGNVMRRDSDGHIFLIDFGLSKNYDTNGAPETSTTIGLGTAGYAPIEQANQAKNGEFRPTIDVYALGATLYKLLTRETPPPASELVTDDELISDKLKEHNVSDAISSVVVNAMLPNVRKRTHTIKAFVEALHSSSEHQPLVTKEKKTVDEEKTLFVGESKTATEETEIIAPHEKVCHPDFDESTYKIDSKYIKFPVVTGNKAKEGDFEAMLALGIMALRGEGVRQDFDTAHAWFLKLKNLGDDRGEKLIAQWTALKSKYALSDKGLDDNNKPDVAQNSISLSNGFTKFFTKYSTAIMIIAGLFFIYDIICYSMEYAPHGDNLHTYFGYGVLHNIIELSLIYTVGVKLLSCNKWYLAIATLGIVLWLGNWCTGWNANYVWVIMGGTLTDGMAEFSQFVLDCSHYGGLLLIIAFLIGVILAKQAISKVIFVLLMIYAGTQFIPYYLNPEDINDQVLSITEYAILLLAIALYFYSEKQKSLIMK